MRALCGVPGLRAGAPLPAAARFLALRLTPAAPTSSPPTSAGVGSPPAPQATPAAPLCLLVDAKARVRDLRKHARTHLLHRGVRHTDIFGIAVLCGGDYLFPDLESKLSKYAPKSWRSSHTHGLDANGRPLLELHLRVQFYVESAALLKDAASRRQYAMQLEEAESRVTLPPAARERLRLARIADDEADADLRYLREACALDQLNAHCYRLRAHKREPEPGSVRLYVRAAGLAVAPDTRPPASFPWPSIGKLSFDRKKFEIRAGESRITLYSSDDEKSKLLLSLCRDTHQFSMKMTPDLADALYRDGDAEFVFGERPPPDPEKGEQRTSLVSSTSSNTTSGIASDRVPSEDEPEIMIDCPPVQGAAVTTDYPAASSETSGVYTAEGSAALPAVDDCTDGDETLYAGNAAASECTSFFGDSYASGDSVDGPDPGPGFRGRADSEASAGSFRGDGSDPTDRLQGPLSAEELSDLIVARSGYPVPPRPPERDSDYVTLSRSSAGICYPALPEIHSPCGDDYPDRGCSPRPPEPPKRIDSARVRDESSISAESMCGPPPLFGRSCGTLSDSRNFLSAGSFSASLRELRLGIPVREPPPYPGRAGPARFPPSRPRAIEPARAVPVPPPPPLTVYTSQLARSQIEQYRRQLYSDVDYVIYPLQDPAISHRDYLDSKVAAACPRGSLCRGNGSQVSDSYIRLPPCVAPPRRQPPPPPFASVPRDCASTLGRARRLPPPPPPAYPRRPPPREPPPTRDPAGPIDIKTLREKSKNLDLPLISALCNDRSLLKQTEAFVMPERHDGRSVGSRAKTEGRRGFRRNPGDALPDLPLPAARATANTYVPDPRPPAIA